MGGLFIFGPLCFLMGGVCIIRANRTKWGKASGVVIILLGLVYLWLVAAFMLAGAALHNSD